MFFNLLTKKTNSDQEKIELQIIGMHCSSCSINVDFALEDLPGVVESKTQYARQVAQVTFDPTQTTSEAIISTIKKLGYDAIPKA